MKKIRIILAIFVIAFCSYVLISSIYEFMPFVMVLLGTFMLVSGIHELQKDRKRFEGNMFIIVSILIISVFLQGYL